MRWGLCEEIHSYTPSFRPKVDHHFPYLMKWGDQKLQWPDEKFIWMQVGLHGYGQSICFTVFRLKYQSPTDSAIDCSVEEKHKDEKTRLCTEMFMKSQFHLVPIKKNIGFSYLIVDFRGIRGMPCFCHPRLAMRKTWNYE